MSEAESSLMNHSALAMSEVSMEKELHTETMMRIDARNNFDNIICFIYAVIILVITLITAYSGPPQTIENTKSYPMSTPGIFELTTTINSLTGYNRFVRLSYTFQKHENSNSSATPINVSVNVLNNNHTLIKYTKKFLIAFEEKNDVSIPVVVFYDRQVFRGNYTIQLKIGGNLDKFKFCNSIVTYGEPTISWVCVILKLIYFTVVLSIFILYVKLLAQVKYFSLSIEQELNLFLIVMCLFYDFPLHNLYIFKMPVIVSTCFTIFTAFLRMFVYFYSTILFYSVRCMKKPSNPFTIIIISISFLVLTIASSYGHIMETLGVYQSRLLFVARRSRKIIDICDSTGDFIALSVMVVASFSLDETEFFRFTIYSIHTVIMLLVNYVSKFLSSDFETNFVPLLLEFTGFNLYVIIMSYLHWPYRYKNDAAYQDAKIQASQQELTIEDNHIRIPSNIEHL